MAPRNINDRLENLRIRRRGLDRLDRLNEETASVILNKSFQEEAWQRRAKNLPYTQYALGAMQPVDSEYTTISHEEAQRVANQLTNKLSNVETRVQGSVPLNVHIRGVSDIDLLLLDTDFLTYYSFGSRADSYSQAPADKTSLSVLKSLRSRAEDVLTTTFWGANVDCSGGKCIALSGGSLRRPVDVVPSHWIDTVAYQASQAVHDREVKILNKKIPETIDNAPFLHIKRVSDRDLLYNGGLKQAIRLVKNVKNDAESDVVLKLPSFDIAALMYHANETFLRATIANELYVLMETQRFFDWCYRNKDAASSLMTPDGKRRVLDTEAKHDGVLAISSELDDLARQVAREQGLLDANTGWEAVRKQLGDARVPL